VEDWTVDHLERTTEKAVKFAVESGLPCMYVTEDTVRTDPDTVKRLYSTAIRNGARAIVLCDTVGHATPNGAFNLVKFTIKEVVKPSGKTIRVDWHGHNDRGLSIANSLAAVAGSRNIAKRLPRPRTPRFRRTIRSWVMMRFEQPLACTPRR
jgi:2-isopropylmalate synthase